MKISGLLFFTLAWPALAQVTAHSLPQQQTSAPLAAESTSSNRRETRGVTQTTLQRDLGHNSGPGRSRAVVKSSSPTPPHRPANGRPNSTVETAAAAHPPVPARSGVAGAPAIRQNTGSATAGHLRPQASFAATHSSPATARHRGDNPAAVGGAANSASENPGSLNGSLMKRRP